jgi:hypothetical protein
MLDRQNARILGGMKTKIEWTGTFDNKGVLQPGRGINDAIFT